MYEKILVPLDGSDVAESALPYAQDIAGRLQSQLILLHVCSPNEQQLRHVHQIYLDHMAETAKGQLKSIQKGQVRMAAKVKPVMIQGEAAQGIIDYVDKNDVGLTVMTTHGRSGITRWAWGSVTDRVLRGMNKPLALIRANAKASGPGLWQKLLVPLDGSKTSEAVLPHVVELARGLGSQLVLLQVVPPAQYIYSVEAYAHAIFTDEQLALVKRDSRDYLARVGRELQRQGVEVVVDVRSGTPAQSILDYAKEISASMIAMTTSGRSGMGRWVFGSVADRVLREGNLPVMLVRAAT